jgi:thioredoxin-related protein
MRCNRAALPLLLLLLFAAPASWASGEAEGEIEWLEDYGSTLKQAKKNGQLILIDFYTTWCTFCKTLDKEVFGDPRVVAMVRDFACAKLDAEVQKAASSRYRPEGFPTILFATSTGEEILRVSGYRPPAEMFTVIEKIAAAGPGIAENLARVKKNKKDLEALETLGTSYLDLGLPDKATAHLNRALKVAAKAGKGAAPDGESAEARILFLLGRAALAEENYKKASQTLRKLLDGHPSSPHREAHFLELEKVYEAWGKTDLAESTRAERLKQFPEGVDVGNS